MASSRRFRIVNVFAESPFGGNPLCVFEDGEGLDAATMQALALQFNLSETTFVLRPTAPGATRRVRIFTPTFEMPFAGHPTLGTAHVVRSLDGPADAVHLQMQAGIVPVQAQGDRWTLQAGAPEWHPSGRTRDEIATMLGIDAGDVCADDLWMDTGSEQWVIPLGSPQAVERCRPAPADLARYSVGNKRRGLAYVWAWLDDRRIRVRFFLERHGSVVEDAGTGSACANLGGWFIARKTSLPLTCEVMQGDHLGRPCRLGLAVDAERRIFVSGRVIELGRGEIMLPEGDAS
jgi:PhzF family phenazine biosynthesis protein